MTRVRSRLAVVRIPVLATALAVGLLATNPAQAAPEGQLSWAVHISIVPTWFDPSEHTGIVTPLMFLYALHDALVKPMPGNPAAPSLAEAWSVSRDTLVYEFTLRKGVLFHNGDPLTAEDVKFSFERYKGGASSGARWTSPTRCAAHSPKRSDGPQDSSWRRS